MRSRFRSEPRPSGTGDSRPLELVRVRRAQRDARNGERELAPRRRRRGGRRRSGARAGGGTGSRGGRPPLPLRPSFWDWLLGLFQPSRGAAAVERRPTSLGEQESRVIAEFCRHYKLEFNDPDLLKLALTHRSYLSVTGQGPRESNERLEFLGDSVLGLVTSEFLYRQHPTEHEGQLTKTKSLLVSKAILSRRGLAMGLGRFVLMSHSEVESGGRQRLSIIADAFEAVLGAIYLDQGFEAARAFIERWLLRDSREIAADKRHTNYKSHLQEYVQSTFRTHPIYRIRSQMGPDHSKQFMVEVMVGRRVLGSGTGRNKKEAEQAAARDALERVRPRGDREPEASVAPPRIESRVEPREETRRPRDVEPREERRPRDVEPREERRPRDEGRRPRLARPLEPVPGEAEEGAIEAGEAEIGREGLRRRRGRRGGRGRRGRGEGPAGETVPPLPSVPEAAPEPEADEEEVVRAPVRTRSPRRWVEPAPVSEPEPLPEVEVPPPAYEEDENEEIGRPEGPLEDRRVDPYAFEPEPRPADERIEAEDGGPRAPLAPPDTLEPEEDEIPVAGAAAKDEEDEEDEAVAEVDEDAGNRDPWRRRDEDVPASTPAAPAAPAAPAFGRRPGRGGSRGGRREPQP